MVDCLLHNFKIIHTSNFTWVLTKNCNLSHPNITTVLQSVTTNKAVHLITHSIWRVLFFQLKKFDRCVVMCSWTNNNWHPDLFIQICLSWIFIWTIGRQCLRMFSFWIKQVYQIYPEYNNCHLIGCSRTVFCFWYINFKQNCGIKDDHSKS